MKKILLVGSIGCGKTTLCQSLNGLLVRYKKTQGIEMVNSTIDTPGEYFDKRSFLSALTVTSVEVDYVLMLQDATSCQYNYSPGQSAAFASPCIGVVTKIDMATSKQIKDAKELLTLAGAETVFSISSFSRTSLERLLSFLNSES